MTIQMAGLDLDGTLYGRHTTISPANRATLQEWHAAGRKITICSGRMPRRVGQLLDSLGVPGYRLCMNGALVYAPDGSRLAARPLRRDVAQRVFDIATRYGVRVRFYGVAYHVLGGPGIRATQTLTGHWNRDLQVTKSAVFAAFLSRPDAQLYKFTLAPALGNIPGYLAALRQIRQLDLHVTRSKPLLHEGMAPGVNKLTGMRVVCQHAGITLAATAGFGDQLNDLELVSGVGLGVAMRNGTARVRAAADVVAPRNTADGVAVVLRALLAGQPSDHSHL